MTVVALFMGSARLTPLSRWTLAHWDVTILIATNLGPDGRLLDSWYMLQGDDHGGESAVVIDRSNRIEACGDDITDAHV